MTAQRASGIVASALASAKQDGINYPEHVADRVLEALATWPSRFIRQLRTPLLRFRSKSR